jgi:hypothetical protein
MFVTFLFLSKSAIFYSEFVNLVVLARYHFILDKINDL